MPRLGTRRTDRGASSAVLKNIAFLIENQNVSVKGTSRK